MLWLICLLLYCIVLYCLVLYGLVLSCVGVCCLYCGSFQGVALQLCVVWCVRLCWLYDYMLLLLLFVLFAVPLCVVVLRWCVCVCGVLCCL